jgi:hypothetical protein
VPSNAMARTTMSLPMEKPGLDPVGRGNGNPAELGGTTILGLPGGTVGAGIVHACSSTPIAARTAVSQLRAEMRAVIAATVVTC